MDSGGPERVGPYDFNDYSQISLMEVQSDEQRSSNIHYADEGWVQTETFVDLSEKFSSDKPEEFEEHLRKRKTEVNAQQKVNKRQKFTFEEAVNQAESLLENDIDLVNELLKQRYEEDNGKVESHENVFLDVRLHNQSDEFVETIFGGRISQRFAETLNHKVASRLKENQTTEKKTQQKQKKLKPQAKIIPVRRESFHIEEQQPESPDKKPPYPMEMEFETVQQAIPKPIDNFSENQFVEEALIDKRGPAVGRALNELFDTSHPSNQWSPNYDVPDRSNDPNAMKIISVGVTEDEPTEDFDSSTFEDNKKLDAQSKEEVLPAINVKRSKQTPTKPIEETSDVQLNKPGVPAKKSKSSVDKQQKLQKISSPEQSVVEEGSISNTQQIDKPIELKEDDVEVAKSLQEREKATINLNTQMSKPPEAEIGSKILDDSQLVDVSKQMIKPGSKLTSLDVEFSKQDDFEKESKILDDSQLVDASKQMIKPGSKMTILDVDLDRQDENELAGLTSIDGQQLSSTKQTIKPGSKTTRLDVELSKQDDFEKDSKILDDSQQLSSVKQVNEFGSKLTSLDADLNKQDENELAGLTSIDGQKSKMAKQVGKLGSKTTRLDASFNKSPEVGNDSEILDDSQQLSSVKQLGKLGSKTTKLDVDLNRQDDVGNDSKILDDSQGPKMAKQVNKPGNKSTILDVGLDRQDETEFNEMTSSDHQKSKMTKQLGKPGSKTTQVDIDLNRQNDVASTDVLSKDDQQLRTMKQVNEASQKSTNLDVGLDKQLESESDNLISPDHQKLSSTKLVSKPGSKSTILDVDLNKQPEIESNEILSSDHQQIKTMKQVNEASQKSTKLDVDLNKQPETDLIDVSSPDHQQIKTMKSANEPSQRSTKLDVDLNKQSDIASIDVLSKDKQKDDVLKQVNEFGKKSTILDVDLDKQPEVEFNEMTSIDGQKSKMTKLVSEPGSKMTKLDISFNKQPEVELNGILSPEHQQNKMTKQLNEPGSKMTKLDVDLNKQNVSEISEVSSPDHQKLSSTKQLNEPGSKKTSLNVDLNKQNVSEISEVSSPDNQTLSSTKQLNKPGSKLTKLDASFDKQPEHKSHEMTSPDNQIVDVSKLTSEPSQKSTKLDVNLNKQNVSEISEVSSPDHQQSKMSKLVSEPGSKKTSLDASFNKQVEIESDELALIDGQQTSSTKQLNAPGSKMTKLDASFNKQPENGSDNLTSPDHQQSKTMKQLNESSQKSIKLDVDLNKQLESGSDEILSPDNLLVDVSKSTSEPSQKSIKLDASFNKQSESKGHEMTSPDNQLVDVLKKLNEPSQKSTILDASFDKQPEIESNEILSPDHQIVDVLKQLNEPGSKKTSLNVDLDKQPESGSGSLISPGHQIVDVLKQVNEPSQKSTKLDASFNKQLETDSAGVLSKDKQKSKMSKQLNEPSQKSTILDATLSKPDVSDQQEIIAPDQQHSKSAKTTSSPSKKSTKLDASFEKSSATDLNSVNLSDIQHDDILKTMKEPSQRLIQIDAAFDKTSVPEDVSIRNLDTQQELTRKSIHPASHQTINLDAEFNQPAEFGVKEVLSPDNQQIKASKTTKLDPDLKKIQIRGQKEENVPTTQPESKLDSDETTTVDANLSREELQDTTRIAVIPVEKQMTSKQTKSSKQIDDKLGIKEVDTQNVEQLPATDQLILEKDSKTPSDKDVSQDIHDKKSSKLLSKELEDEQIKKRELETSYKKKSLKSPIQQKSIDKDVSLEETRPTEVKLKPSKPFQDVFKFDDSDKAVYESLISEDFSAENDSLEFGLNLSPEIKPATLTDDLSTPEEKTKLPPKPKAKPLKLIDDTSKLDETTPDLPIDSILSDDQPKAKPLKLIDDTSKLDETTPDLSNISESSKTEQFESTSLEMDKRDNLDKQLEGQVKTDELNKQSELESKELQKQPKDKSSKKTRKQNLNDDQTKLDINMTNEESVTKQLEMMSKKSPKSTDQQEDVSVPDKHQQKTPTSSDQVEIDASKDLIEQQSDNEVTSNFAKQYSVTEIKSTDSNNLLDDKDQSLTKDVAEIGLTPPKKLPKKKSKNLEDAKQSAELKTSFGRKQENMSSLLDDTDLSAKKELDNDQQQNLLGGKLETPSKKPSKNLRNEDKIVNQQEQSIPDTTSLDSTDLNAKKSPMNKIGAKDEDQQQNLSDSTLLDEANLISKKETGIKDVEQQQILPDSTLIDSTDLSAKNLSKNLKNEDRVIVQQEEEPSISSLIADTDLSAKKLPKKKVKDEDLPGSILLDSMDLSAKRLHKKKLEAKDEDKVVVQQQQDLSGTSLLDDTNLTAKKKVKDEAQQQQNLPDSSLIDDVNLIFKKKDKDEDQEQELHDSTLIDDTDLTAKKEIKDEIQQQNLPNSTLLDDTDLIAKKLSKKKLGSKQVEDKVIVQQQEEPPVSNLINDTDLTSDQTLPKKKLGAKDQDKLIVKQQQDLPGSILLDDTNLIAKKKVKDEDLPGSILLDSMDLSAKKLHKKKVKDEDQQQNLPDSTLIDDANFSAKKLSKEKAKDEDKLIVQHQQDFPGASLLDSTDLIAKRLPKKETGIKDVEQQQSLPDSNLIDDTDLGAKKKIKDEDQQQELPDSSLVDSTVLTAKKKVKDVEDKIVDQQQKQEELPDLTSKKLSKKKAKDGDKIFDQQQKQELPSSILIDDTDLTSNKKLSNEKLGAKDEDQQQELPDSSLADSADLSAKKPIKKKLGAQDEDQQQKLPKKKLGAKHVKDEIIVQQEELSGSTLIDDTNLSSDEKPSKKKAKHDVKQTTDDQQREDLSDLSLVDDTDLTTKKEIKDIVQQEEEPSISNLIDSTDLIAKKKLGAKDEDQKQKLPDSTLIDDMDLSSKKLHKKKVGAKLIVQQEEEPSISKEPTKLSDDRELKKGEDQQQNLPDSSLLEDTLEASSKKPTKKKIKVVEQQQNLSDSTLLGDTDLASDKNLPMNKIGAKDEDLPGPSSTDNINLGAKKKIKDDTKSSFDQRQEDLPDLTLLDEMSETPFKKSPKKKPGAKEVEGLKQATELKASFDRKQESLSDSTLIDNTDSANHSLKTSLSAKKPKQLQEKLILDDSQKVSVDIEAEQSDQQSSITPAQIDSTPKKLKSKKPKEEPSTLQPTETDLDANLKKKSDKDTQLSKTTKDVPNSEDQKSQIEKLITTSEKLAATTISPTLTKEQSKENMIIRMPETVTESSTWNSPKKPPTVPQSAASDTSGKFGSEQSGSGTPNSSSTQSKYDARRLREERASTPGNFKFVQLRKVQRVQKPVKQEVVEQPIKPKFNPKRKMISTSVGGVVVSSVKLMASPEPKLSIYHGEDYMEESENLKIIVDKDRWAYTICLCIYNVSPQLSGQLSLVATNELGSDKCLLFIDVSDAGKLNIGELPSIECNVADRVDALVDEDVKLQFKVRSILPPEVWIEQNGVQLSPELLTIDTEGETTTVTFEIRKCKITDKAIYKCCVINKYGSSSFTVYLNVQTKVDQSPKTPTTPIEPTILRRKNKPGSLTIPKEINSLYGDPSVKVSLTNVTTELSATNDYAATDSSSPIKEVMSATVSKSVDASHSRSRRKGASRYTFNYKRTQSAPAHQISGEMKEMEDELNASNKLSMDKEPEPASTNQQVLDELKKELDMAKIADDKKSKKPLKISSLQKDDIPQHIEEVSKISSPQKDDISQHIEEVPKTSIDSEVPKIEESLQPKQMKNQSEQTSAPPKVKAKKTKASKDETTQILADFNKTSIETQTMINAPEHPHSFVEHTTVPTKDKEVFVDPEQQIKLDNKEEIEPIQETTKLPDPSKSIKKRKVKKVGEELEKQTSMDFEFNRDENEKKELSVALNEKESETSHIKLSKSRLSEEDLAEKDLLEDAKRKQELKDKFGKDRQDVLDEKDQLKDASKRLKKAPKSKISDEDILEPANLVDDQIKDLEPTKLDNADKLTKKLPKKKVEDEEEFGSIQLKPVTKRSKTEPESSEIEGYKLKPTQFDEKSVIDGAESINLKKVPTGQHDDEQNLNSADFDSEPKDSSKSLKQPKPIKLEDDSELKDSNKTLKQLSSTDFDSEPKDSSKTSKKLPKKKVEDEGGFENIQLKPVTKRSQKQSESSEVEDYKLKPTQFDEKSILDDKESIRLKNVPTDQHHDERNLDSTDFDSEPRDSDKSFKQMKTVPIDQNDGQKLKSVKLDNDSLEKVPIDQNDGQKLKSTNLSDDSNLKDTSGLLKKLPKDDSDLLKKSKSTNLDDDFKLRDDSHSLNKDSNSLKEIPKDQIDEKDSISLKKVLKDDSDLLNKDSIGLKKVPKDDSDSLKEIPKDDSDSLKQLPKDSLKEIPKEDSDSLKKVPKGVKSTINDTESISLKEIPKAEFDADSLPKDDSDSLKEIPKDGTTSLKKAPKAEFDVDSLSKPKDVGEQSLIDDRKLLKKTSKPKVNDDGLSKHDVKSLKKLPETEVNDTDTENLPLDNKLSMESPKRIDYNQQKLEEMPKDDQLTKPAISDDSIQSKQDDSAKKLKRKAKTLAEQASKIDDMDSTTPESQIYESKQPVSPTINDQSDLSLIEEPKSKLKKKKAKQPSEALKSDIDDIQQPMTKDEILEDHKKGSPFFSEEVKPSSEISDSIDIEEPIRFIKGLDPSTIGHVGEAIELSVELSRPAQELKWLFNQKEIPLSSDEYRINVKGNQISLEVLNPTFDMSGTYSVMADDVVTSTQLEFHGQPILEDSADSAIELNAKDDLKLKCKFKANPEPDIQIFLNNEPLDDPEAFVEVETDTITLSRPTMARKNSGIYSFVVRNTYGKAEKHVKVVVCDVPEAPQNLKVESFGSDFVEISWMPPESGSSSLLHYRIEMKEAKRRVFQRAGQIPANTTRFRIEGLDIDRLYMFKVAAINKFGTGEFCTPVEQTTNVPFEAPQIEKPPRVVSIDEKVCKLEWSPCLNTGGSPIYSYDVYMREGDSGDWVKVNDDEVFVPSFSIKDKLEPGKVYSFKIEATNEAGISSNSNVPTENVLCPKNKSIDIFDAPTVEITSPNSVNVKWDRPADLPADQKLKSVVFYKSEQSPVWNKLLTTDDELEIRDLKPELAYIFRVETELPDSTTLSSGETSPISLTTAEKPRITKPLKDVDTIKSNELRLEVQALSDPAPSFEWTKDGKEVPGAQISNDGTSSVLTISFANDADQGLYTCKVTNVHGSVESSAQITVKQPPINILTAFPENLNATTGTELELACELSHEDATVNWLKNGQPLLESDRIQFVEIGTKRQLIIKNAEKEDSADYVCVSSDGNSRARCKVNVKEPEAHVKFGPEDQTITSLGETATIECELTSPVETLCWLQNGRPIDLNSPKYTVVNDGLKCTLKIAEFDKSAIGDYVLQLPNGELSAPANLQLKIPAKIEVDFDELFAHAGKELSFAVRISGFPTPTFNGTLNGVPIKDLALIDDIDEENIKVTIKSMKPEHTGELKLKIKNDSNEDSKSIPVKVASVPQQPASVSATLVGEDLCEVRWSPITEDENAPITEYIIERKTGDQTRWRQCGQIDAKEELLFVAEELPPDELIMFRVIAVNEVGRGKPSRTVDVVTEPKREEQVSEEISQIESALQERIEEESNPTATLKDNGVELTWKAMENVKLYAIERRSSNNGTWVQIACTDRNWFVDQTIKEPGNYSYRVIAHFDGTEQKYSEPTNEVSVEEKDISVDEDETLLLNKNDEKLGDKVDSESDMNPSAKLTPDGVEVKWTAIGNVKLYAIERRKSGDSIWVQLDCVRFNSFVDQTIKESGQYVYRVVAQFKDGNQSISSPTNKIRIEDSDVKLLGAKSSAEDVQFSGNLNEDQSANAKIKKKPEAKVFPKRRGEQLEEDVQTIEDDESLLSNLSNKNADSEKTVGLKSRQDDSVGFDVRGRRRRKLSELSDQENADLSRKGSDSDASAKRDASPPIVIPQIEVLDSPTELTADEEAEAVFEFKFDQLPEGITISWLKDGRPLNTIGRRKFQSSVEDGVVRLKVNNLSSDDEGDYSCRINFGDVPLAECSTKLDVRRKAVEEPSIEPSSLLEPVDFKPKRVKRRALSDIEPPVPLRLLRELQDDEVKLGASTTLSVTYSSSIVPEFKFFKNGKQIINLPGWYTIKQDGGRLLCTIENATLDDEGEWMLVVETPQSTIETKCRITVKVPPKPVEVEKLPTHDVFESALPAITRIRQRLDSETSSASSPASKRLRQIEEEPKERGEPPKFHHLLEDLSAREGEHVVLSVTSTTIPEPNVQWYRSGILIERTNSNYIIKVETGRFELEILSCSKQDNGEWMAIGETRFGRCESKCILTVLDARRKVEPYFAIGLQSQTYSIGSMIILEVNVRGTPDPDLQWFKNEQLLQHGSEYRIVGNNNLNTLTILEAAKTHAGMYEVVAENEVGKARTSCVVTVNDPTHGSSKAEETQIPIVRMPLLPVREIPEGTELNLVCTITGSPLPKIEWQKDDQSVVGAYFRYDNGVATMTILRAELNHSGVYTAIGSNKFGSTRTSCVLYVKPSADSNRTAPKFEDPLTNVSLLTGKELCLECRVVCKPQSSLKLIWYKDGIKMLPSNRLLQYVDRRGVVRLNLMDCRLEDAGEYGVQAENSLGQDFTHCMVRITDASTRKSSAKALHYKPDSRAPLVTRPLQDCTVHVGNQGLLECEVQAASGATAEWTQNGQLLAESRTLRSYFDGRLALLKIFDADKSHEGEYQLFIEDKYGQITSNAMVTVEDVDQEHLPHMPEFTKTFGSQLIESEGSSVNLCCEVQGLPTPSLIWLLNGITLQLSSEIQSQIDGNTHTLSIYPFSSKYCGTITAIAKNIYGEVHHSTDIQLKKNN